jgi:hypothetical protein
MVFHVIFRLHYNVLVTIIVVIVDDYIVRIDNVQEYYIVHDNFHDEMQQLLLLLQHFHEYENVHMLVMSIKNHLKRIRFCLRKDFSSFIFNTNRAVGYHYFVEVLHRHKRLVRV